MLIFTALIDYLIRTYSDGARDRLSRVTELGSRNLDERMRRFCQLSDSDRVDLLHHTATTYISVQNITNW